MDKDQIVDLILSGGGRTASYTQRCTWWLALLGILKTPSTVAGGRSIISSGTGSTVDWVGHLQQARLRYSELIKTLPARPDLANEDDDPLSVNSSGNSAWQKFFEDEKLCKTIVIDLERTHPDSEFFQLKSTQDSMLNILFIWSRLHPDVSYRQGMNELLSPIFLVVSKSHTSGAGLVDVKHDDSQLSFQEELVNPEFIEHDSFALFEAVMLRMRKYFVVTNDVQVEKEKPDLMSEDPLAKQEKVNPLVATCDKIQKRLLKKIDVKLSDHLTSQGVEPQIYGLRWVRLLFAREFHIEDTLLVWDFIFTKADEKDFPFVSAISIAMLQFVREYLLDNDSSGCLMRLMKYPPVEDVIALMENAVIVEIKLNGGNVPERSPSPIVQLAPGVPSADPLICSHHSPVNQAAVTGKNILQSAPKLVNDMMGQIAKINIFGSLGAHEEKMTGSTSPQHVNRTHVPRVSTVAQYQLEAKLKRSKEISEGVGYRIGELTQELREFLRDSNDPLNVERAELIVAELDALAGVLNGLIDPDVSNMWSIVDPLIGQRKIYVRHEE